MADWVRGSQQISRNCWLSLDLKGEWQRNPRGQEEKNSFQAKERAWVEAQEQKNALGILGTPSRSS